MTDPEPTPENEELTGPIRRLIDAYRMGTALDPKNLYAKASHADAAQPRPVTQPV